MILSTSEKHMEIIISFRITILSEAEYILRSELASES